MDISAILIDIDGTLFIGDEPIPGASSALTDLRKHGIKYRFLSNGTRKSRMSVLKKVRRLDIPVCPDEIFTPAVAAIWYLKNKGISRCDVLVTGDVTDDFIQAGIEISEDAPVIIIGDAGENFTYPVLNKIFRRVIDGAEVLALEKDRFWMDKDGLSLAAGPFITALEYSSGRSFQVIGKPSPFFFQMALESLGASTKEAMMIGDDLITDVGGGIVAGLMGVLVKTGKFRKDILKDSPITPDAMISSIKDLPVLLESLREAR